MSKSISKIVTMVMALVLCFVCAFSVTACDGGSSTTYAVTITGDNLEDGAVSLKTGATLDLTATITADGKVDKSLTATWSTSDESVATVSDGTVTAEAEGTAEITASYSNASSKVIVTVTNKEISYQGQTSTGTDEYMYEPMDVYWLDASVQYPDTYTKIVGFSLTVTIDSLDYYGGGKDTQEFECGAILVTKGSHSPSEYVFTYYNGQYPEYSLATKDIVTFGFGEAAFVLDKAFSNGRTSNEDAKVGDTITFTYSTGDKSLFSSGDPIMTVVSYLGTYTYLSVEWELGNPTDVEEEWDTVETTVWSDIETVEYSSMQNGKNYVDITIPATGEDSYPVILWIHGGGYITGDRANVALSTTKQWLLTQGYAFVSVDYTLTGNDGTDENGYTIYTTAGMPQMIKDVKLAIRFLRANASTYSLDTSFIAAMGESAGAGLALLCATTNSGSAARATYGDDYYEDLTTGWANYSSDVQAAISYCGPTCFSGDYLGNMSAYLGSTISNYSTNELETLSKIWSPVDIIDDTCAPLYLTYSEADGTVPISHYNDFVTLVNLYGITHKDVIYEASKGIGHVDRSGFDQYSAYLSLTNWLSQINV